MRGGFFKWRTNWNSSPFERNRIVCVQLLHYKMSDTIPYPAELLSSEIRERNSSFCGELFDLSESDRQLISQLSVPVAKNENERIKVLRQVSHIHMSWFDDSEMFLVQTKLLDSETADPTFDRFTSLCSRLFDVPISLVSLVDVNRQWFKSRVGLDATETHRFVSFAPTRQHSN